MTATVTLLEGFADVVVQCAHCPRRMTRRELASHWCPGRTADVVSVDMPSGA